MVKKTDVFFELSKGCAQCETGPGRPSRYVCWNDRTPAFSDSPKACATGWLSVFVG